MKIYRYMDGNANASGRKIKELREAAGLSQEQLAAKVQLVGLNLNQRQSGARLRATFLFRSVRRVRGDSAGQGHIGAGNRSFFMRKSAKNGEISLTLYS